MAGGAYSSFVSVPGGGWRSFQIVNDPAYILRSDVKIVEAHAFGKFSHSVTPHAGAGWSAMPGRASWAMSGIAARPRPIAKTSRMDFMERAEI